MLELLFCDVDQLLVAQVEEEMAAYGRNKIKIMPTRKKKR
jgi:hypothetical protein